VNVPGRRPGRQRVLSKLAAALADWGPGPVRHGDEVNAIARVPMRITSHLAFGRPYGPRV